MAIIGRLDSQVDEIIISPVSKRRREDAPASAGVLDEETRQQPEAAAPSTPQTPHAEESSAGADELPVWML